MSTTTIHPPTSQGAHAGRPAGDPAENIAALRQYGARVEELERDLADALAVNARQAEQLAVLRAHVRQYAYADRIRSHEADLLAEVRALTGQLDAARATIADLEQQLAAARAELEYRGRHRRWGR